MTPATDTPPAFTARRVAAYVAAIGTIVGALVYCITMSIGG